MKQKREVFHFKRILFLNLIMYMKYFICTNVNGLKVNPNIQFKNEIEICLETLNKTTTCTSLKH